MSESIADRVARGAEFLKDRDSEWYNKIDLGRFDIINACNCILGQLYGDFWRELTTLFDGSEDRAFRYGFTADRSKMYSDADGYDGEFVELQHEWVRVIKALRNGGSV